MIASVEPGFFTYLPAEMFVHNWPTMAAKSSYVVTCMAVSCHLVDIGHGLAIDLEAANMFMTASSP